MSNPGIIDLEKIKKKRAAIREYRKKTKAAILSLSPIKEVEKEEEEESTPPSPIPQLIIQKEKIKHLFIKPDFTLLLMNQKLHRRLMNELLRRTAFLHWLKKYDIVMNEFTQKAAVYNEYHDKCDFYEDLFSILEREITLPFLRWFEKFKNVMGELNENQL